MNTVIGNKLRSLRKAKGFSQEQTADYLHISQSAYARMESGESNSWASLIEPICSLFEIEPNELLKNEPILINNNQKGGNFSNSMIINQLSEKLINNYENQTMDLKLQIKELKDQLVKNEEEEKGIAQPFY